MKPDRSADLFIVYIQLPMSLVDIIAYSAPEQTMNSHVLELSHSARFPLPLRWSYDYVYRAVADIDENRMVVLTWGERWCFLGTEIMTDSDTTD